MLTSRKVFLLGFLSTAALLLTALFMQYKMGLEPCPLCLMQRIAFMAIALVCFLALVIRYRWFQKTASALMMLFAIGGGAIASRQLWLQSLPADQVPTCGPGFDYMISNFPLSKALSLILSGSGECAEVQWRFLGLSIPGWSLLMFIGFVALACYVLFSRRINAS